MCIARFNCSSGADPWTQSLLRSVLAQNYRMYLTADIEEVLAGWFSWNQGAVPLGELRPTAGQPRRASYGHQLSKTLFQRPFKHLNTPRPAVNMTKMCASGRCVETEPSGHKRSQIPNPEKIRTSLLTLRCAMVSLSCLQAWESPWPRLSLPRAQRCKICAHRRTGSALSTVPRRTGSATSTVPRRTGSATSTVPRRTGSALSTVSRRGLLRHQLCLAGRALRYQLCLAGRALRYQLCLAGDCCDNKASSDAQAPLRGARDQYSKILRVFEEAKTCATSSSCSYSEGSDDP